jgi:hypothetical protein
VAVEVRVEQLLFGDESAPGGPAAGPA